MRESALCFPRVNQQKRSGYAADCTADLTAAHKATFFRSMLRFSFHQDLQPVKLRGAALALRCFRHSVLQRGVVGAGAASLVLPPLNAAPVLLLICCCSAAGLLLHCCCAAALSVLLRSCSRFAAPLLLQDLVFVPFTKPRTGTLLAVDLG